MQTPPPRPPSPMSSSSSAAAAALMDVDRGIWRAVAGATARIPAVNSFVYYFPQGHLEQFSTSAAVKNHNFTVMHPCIACQVISLRFLSDPASDQVFIKILLRPLGAWSSRRDDVVSGGADDDEDVVSFAKILTRSDANNGGGFSVPRFCADIVLPQLNFLADPPVQNLVMRDTHNNAWEFRHIYRGTPRRHLLTTGWSKYVNAKRLIAGDSVVFMRKKSTNELFVGVRRAERFGRDAGEDGAEAVSAIENAVRGMPFEVVYFPKVGSPDFVVMVEKVNQAVGIPWDTGMRVKMAVEADDSSRITWIQGVVATAVRPTSGPWCGSPWRMLQVTWDENESSENVKKVSPWEVEYIPLSPLMDPADFHHSKRLKLLQDSGMLPGSCRDEFFSIPPPPPPPPPAMRSRDQSMAAGQPLNYNPHQPFPFPFPFAFPAPGNGMQGARQGGITINHPTPTPTPTTNIPSAASGLPAVSTVLSIGSSYTDQQLMSPVSQGSVQSGGDADPSSRPCSTIQLFGMTIQTSSSSENAAGASSCRCAAATATGEVCKCNAQ